MVEVFNLESFEEKIKRRCLERPLTTNKAKKYNYVKTQHIKHQPENEGKKKAHPLKTIKWKSIRAEIIEAYGGSCMRCGEEPEKRDVHIDHIKPKSKYPDLVYDKSNLQVLCRNCNFLKSNTDETDYRKINKFDNISIKFNS